MLVALVNNNQQPQGLNGWFGRMIRKLSNAVSNFVNENSWSQLIPFVGKIARGLEIAADGAEWLGLKTSENPIDNSKLDAWYPVFESYYKNLLQRIATLSQNFSANSLNNLFVDLATIKHYYSYANPENLTEQGRLERKNFVFDAITTIETELAQQYNSQNLIRTQVLSVSIPNLTIGNELINARQIPSSSTGGIVPTQPTTPTQPTNPTQPSETEPNPNTSETFFAKNKKWIGLGVIGYVAYQIFKPKKNK